MSKIDLTQKPGSLQAWLDYLDSIDPNKMKLGLERIKVVLERLNLSLFNEIPVLKAIPTPCSFIAIYCTSLYFFSRFSISKILLIVKNLRNSHF